MRDDAPIIWTGSAPAGGRSDCPWAALDRVLDRIRSDPRWRGEMRAGRRWAARHVVAANEAGGRPALPERAAPPRQPRRVLAGYAVWQAPEASVLECRVASRREPRIGSA